MANEIAPPVAPVLDEAPKTLGKVKTYHWTAEQIEQYLKEKYPNLQKPESKKSTTGAWQTKNTAQK